jgi:hypothetical protein
MAEIPGKPINLGGVAKGLPTYTPSPSYSPGPGNDGRGALSFDEMVSTIPTGGDKGVPSIPTSSLYIGDRYKYTFPFRNTEEMAAQQQSTMDKWANGFAKMAGTAATTFLAGTVGTIVGVGNYIGSGFKFSAFYDNPVNRGLDVVNDKMEDYLPNYYTQAEKDANWFGSENLLTANFWADKVIKNLGFSIGTLGAGFAWGAALRAIGLTNRLVQAGKGLETATKVEQAIAAAAPTARFGAISNTLSTLSNQYLRPLAATALTNAERGIVSVMGTMGESSFESLQAMNDYRDRMIDAYFERYGTRPTGADLDEINQYAENVGNFTWGMNAALLSATNYIQLPKILSSSRNAERRLMNDVVKSKVDDAATLTEKVGAKFEAAPSIYQTVAGGTGRAFQKFVARPIGLLFSPVEAFEEGAQFAISTGVDDYFNRAFENREDTSSFFANLGGALKNVFSTGVNETLSSKEGMESILIGGISGGIQTSFSPFGMSEVKERGLSGEGGVRKRNTDIALEELNKSKKLNEVFKDAVKYINIGINSQKLRREAISENDTLSEKDYEKDYTLSYIMPRVKYGKLDSIREELNLYKQAAMSDEGFAELYADGIVLQNETREKFLQRIERVRDNAESVAKIYETFDDSYSSVVDDSGKRKYSDNVIEKMVYATAKIADYDERLASLDNNLSERGLSTSTFKNALVGTEAWKEGNIREALRSPEVEEALTEVAGFINDQELDVTKNELRRDFGDFAEMALRRKLFIDEFNNILKSPESYEGEGGFAEEVEPETGAIVKQQVTPEGAKRKKTINKELEFGREYSLRTLGKVEDGKLKAAPKLTLLSKTVFGDLEVKLPNGKVVFMKPEEFRRYEVVDDVVDDAQAEEIVNDAIDSVLRKRKYSSIPKPEGNKVTYVNSLNNPQLLADIEKEIAARSEKFFEVSEKEERTSKEQAVNQALAETSDSGIQTREPGAGSFEPDSRKTDQEVVNSTKPPVEAYSQEEPLAEHHVRANRFGANFYTFANRDNFRGVIVTQGNQAQLGIPGLTQWLKDKGRGGEEVDPAKTIALVVMGIDPITNERYFVGENGEKLAKPTLDTIIYQAFPESLEWSGGGSMFRESTPDDVRKALTKDYMAWREATLKSPTNDLYRISASFGSPRYVGELNENGKFKADPTARVAVEDSGLVSEKELRTKRVVGVPTTDGAVVYGSSTFNDVKGVPILYSHNGLVRLDNRNITKPEAELIYSAIERLASNLFKDKNLKSGESVMLYNWLKSVIYWGTPKDPQGNRKPAGFSSVFFENQQLIMGKEEKKFSIKPSALKANKAAIVEELQKMYNNVNSTLVSGGQKKDWNKPYTEITAITPEGIQTREWKNYQSFLLSKKNPDGSARNPKTIPLTTRIRPLKDSEDTNRKGIYFTLIDKKGNTSQEVPPKQPAKKVVVPPTATEAKKTQPVKKFDLQGKENILPTKLGDIPFTIDKKKFDETDGKQGILLPDPATDPQYKLTLEGAITKLSTIPNSGVTEDTPDEQAVAVAENVLRNLIRAEIKKQIAPAPAAPAAAPVSDIEEVDSVDEVQTRLNEDLGVTSKITIDSYLNGLHYVQTEDGKYYVIPDSNAAGYGDMSAIEVTKEQIIKPFRTEAEWKKVGIDVAALEGAKPTIAPSLQERVNQRKKAGPTKRGSDFRLMIAKDLEKLKPENWSKVEQWLKTNYPNIPVYRVKNYILAANGMRAHGMFKDGAIYLSETGEVGTVYHEVFHAVWQALTDPAERAQIASEFRGRNGSFFDRASLKNVKYTDATDKQMEEKLAEELRDYIQEGKVPQKPAGPKSLIAKLFADIVNFFKTFFTGEKAAFNTEELFKKIGSGYFAQATPYDSPLSFAKRGFIDIDEVVGGELADYNLDVFTGEQVHDLMQHMTYITVRDLFEENEGLFQIVKKKKAGMYDDLQTELGDLMADNVTQIEGMIADGDITAAEGDVMIGHYNKLYENILDNWDSLVEKHEEYIRSYNIEFDENDEIDLNTLEKGKDDPYGDARKIDNMRKTNAAVKLLLASLPIIQSDGTERLSSIGGYTLLPMSEIFMGVMNNVHTSRSMTEMLSRVKAMSEDDPKYIKLYNRLSRLKNIDELDNAADLQLLSAFWRSFKKQSPAVKTVYILDNGDVQVGDANFTTAARQVKDEFVNDIKEAIAKGSKYFKKSENGKSYIGNADAIKKDVKQDSLEKQVAFLNEIGIEFDGERLAMLPERTKFSEAVNGIRTSIANGRSVMTIGGRTLDIDLRLRQLAEIKAKMDNPEFSSTYYNVNGELTQTFIGTNAASDLYDMLSQIDNLSELANTQYEYLLTDSFAKNSVLLYKMFDKESGDRIQDTEDIMQPAYADGTVNEKKGRQRESSKLNYKERLVQEINLNMAGFYLNLVPGDASIEHMSNMGNFVDKSEILTNYNRVHTIFRGYLEDEVALVKEDRPVADGKNSGDLRFFKSILGEDLQNKVLAYEGSITELYASEDEADVKLVKDINEAIDKFINKERDRTRNLLAEYGAIKVINNQLVTEGLSFGRDGMTDEELNNQLAALSINYAINNIELHKLLYSDPYQYSDELKRIKNFHSPRQAIINSSDEMNTAFHQTWNKGFAQGDLGFTDFERDFFRAATIDDVESMSDLQDYGTFKETDGGGIISLKALRNFKIRAGEWDDTQEAQYKYDIVWEKQDKGGKLTGAEKKILRKGNPKVMRTYTPIKPIVSGNKANGRPYNDVVLDKFALYPFSYRMLKEINPTSNAIKLYDKMQAEDVDYVVFKSGRKVGAEETFSLYDENGNFNTESFETEEQKNNPMMPQTVLNVPFAIMSIQSDVPSKEENEVTRGSQMTKLATLDFMAAGVPIDFRPDIESFTERYNLWFALDENGKLGYNDGDNLYKEIKNNQDILEALVEEGVYALTSEFGLTKVDEGYKIESFDKVAEAIRREVTKREVNDNISAALKGYKSGSVILEATPAYQQIRNVLYSIADRNVMSPKMSGGMKVQIPSTLLEGGTRKVKDGVYASDILKFYEDKDGKRYCEIMVARWFKSDLSDDELLDELKKTGILEGVGFRIPTQKQNSIDSFVIKRFLPEEFGDAVVIPSALVKKVGSDFDIDKLNVYLKNVDVNPTTGEIRLIPYQGATEEARNKFKYRSDFKKSLENGYIESLQKLVSHPLNFKNLVKPNSADQMKKLSREIVDKLGLGTFDYNIAGNMISRRFMSRLRHALVTGKYAIGIAAVAQTNHSLNQRTPIYIDFEGRKDMLSLQDRKFLGDGKIKFAEYNTLVVGNKVVPTVSMIESAKKKNPDTISDTIGQFIDGYVDISKDTWIMEIGATPTVASTWLFLIKVGVPIETVSYFMNQPIIREYLREIEKSGTNWLFDERLSKKLLEKNLKYKGKTIKVEQVPDNDVLFDMIGKKELNPTEKAQQRFMLREFLKYSKMGQQLFYVTQGTNFDTSSFNDPFLIFKKLYQLDKARKTIFSSVDDILESSFLGKMKDGLLDVRNAYSEVLLSDRRGTLREIIQDVLTPYVNMNDRDFIRTSQRVVSTLFDWAKQVDDNLAERIGDVLLSKDKNVAKRMKDFVTPILDPKNSDHPLHNNHVLKLLRFDFADAEQEVNNIKLANKTNKVYDQNQIIYAFKELKNYLKSQNNEALYNDLLTLAVLQSGLTPSTISFTNLLPYDDLVSLYNSSIANLPGMTSLNAFRDLNVFERTFWNYDDVVPHMEAKYVTDYLTGVTEYNTNMAFKPEIYNAMKAKELPILLKVSPISREANYDVIVYTYEKQFTAKQKREMRSRGDYSYIKRGLFKKVGLVDNGTGVMTFIYKAINAWGDGIYAKEFYDTARKSQIDNGYIESDETITDAKILSYFGIAPTASEEVEDDAAPDVVETEEKPEVVVDFDSITEFTPERKTQIIANFAKKHKLTEAKAKEYINDAMKKDAKKVINKLKECY